jgi:hypothetical protein
MSDAKGSSALIYPESTIESANRRGFIKKAAALTAAAAIGGTALKGVAKAIPESFALSDVVVRACCVCVIDCTTIDSSQKCNGASPFACPSKSVYPAFGKLIFGTGPSGERIGSQRNTNTICCAKVSFPPGTNLDGLDFYTDFRKRMSVTNSGLVGIGTCAPCSQLTSISTTSNAVFGCSTASCKSGVYGKGRTWGVVGCGTIGVKGTGGPIGVVGCTSLENGTAVVGSSGAPTVIPFVAKGSAGQIANLQQWQRGTSIVDVVSYDGSIGVGVASPQRKLCVNGRMHASCGLGLGTQTINTTFALNGSMSARAKIVKASYSMTTTDYAIIANSTSPITVTLPPANSGGSFGTCIGGGMIVFIKNASTSAVTVNPHGTDTIETQPTISLGKQFDSLQLIANGTNEWFILAGAMCGAFVS